MVLIPEHAVASGGMTVDDTALRAHGQAHADAILAGDGAALMDDFAEEAKPLMKDLGRMLPRPVTAAEVVSVSDGGQVDIRYSGEPGTEHVVVRATWADRDGRLRIVAAERA